jgi:Uri superfamily endonuclease
LGDDSQGGSYLLRIRVEEQLQLTFGRFQKGKPVAVPAGEYLYVGSALADRGATSLARRLVRHATRSGQRGSHPIRDQMLDRFAAIGLGRGGLRPRRGKKLFWHVDYIGFLRNRWHGRIGLRLLEFWPISGR